MAYLAFNLLFMLVLIFISAKIFTDALEALGEKAGLSAGIVGSIFTAVATALPETMVPVLALVAGSHNQTTNEQVSIGAILGAPLMLSTLSVFVMTLSIIKKRGLLGHVQPEPTGFARDLHFFITAFLVAAAAMYIPENMSYLRTLISVFLIGLYVLYLFLTCAASKKLVESGHGVSAEAPLLITKLGLKNINVAIVLQSLLGLGLLIVGAHGFILSVEKTSEMLQVSALVLSLLIIPIATELPEKINSVIWIRKNKDTLACGNITGALVFQGTLLPALGVAYTPWQPNEFALVAMAIALLGALWMRFNMRKLGLPVWSFLINGLLYLFYVIWALG